MALLPLPCLDMPKDVAFSDAVFAARTAMRQTTVARPPQDGLRVDAEHGGNVPNGEQSLHAHPTPNSSSHARDAPRFESSLSCPCTKTLYGFQILLHSQY